MNARHTTDSRVSNDRALSRLVEWRERLLGAALLTAGLALGGGGLVYLIAVPSNPVGSVIYGLLGVAALNLCLYAWRTGPFSVRSTAFIAGGAVGGVLLGLLVGWRPGYVYLQCLLVVLAGILRGRAAAALLIALIGVTMAFGRLAIAAGWWVQPSSDADPTVLATWLRIAALFFLAGLLLSLLMRYVLGVVRDAERSVKHSLVRLRSTEQGSREARAQRMTAETRLRESQRLLAMGQLRNGLAHLFNNALTAMYGALDRLQRARSPSARAIAADELAASAEAAGDITRELMIFSRRDQRATTAIDAKRVIDDNTPVLRRALPENIELVFALADLPPVSIDAVDLNQLLLNLLLNARDAMPRGGRAHVTAELYSRSENGTTIDPVASEHDYVAVEVRDSGVGMAPEVLERACEPFFTTRGFSTHAGLGLSVALGIARQAGGTLRLHSRPGQGTTVAALLPVRPPTHTTKSDTELGIAAARPAQRNARASATTPAVRRSEHAAGHPPGETGASAKQHDPPQPQRLADKVTEALRDPDDWRPAALQRITKLVLAALAAILVLILLLEDFEPATYAIQILVLGIAGLSAAVAVPRLGYGLQAAMLLVTTGAVCGAAILRYSFMAPVPIALLVFIVLWSSLLTRGWTLALVLGVTSAWLVASGVLYARADVPAVVTPSRPENWVRIAIALPIGLSALAATALSLVNAATANLRRLSDSLAALESAQARSQHERDELERAEGLVDRAARLEAAGHIAGRVAHDMNNALQAIIGNAWLASDTDDSEELRELTQTIAKSIEEAESLVCELNPVADKGTARPVSLVAAINRTTRALGDAKRATIHVDCAVDDAHSYVLAPTGAVQRVLVNVLNNAVSALSNGGTIELRLRRANGALILEVEDSGSGMSEATLAQVFEPFFTTRSPGEGTGLGLPSVRELMADCGGSIDVQSELGAGTCVTLRWPAIQGPAESDASAQAAPQAPALQPTDQRLGRVLLVEDDAAVRSALARALIDAGFEVIAAADGEHGMQHATTGEPWNALCTDAIMPGVPVQELIEAFQDSNPGAPVLLCSGHLPETLAHVPQLPGVTFLHKPFTAQRLRDTLLNRLASP